MYFGVVETESLEDSQTLKPLNIIKVIVENHPKSEEKVWHVNILKIDDIDLEQTLGKFANVMKEEWFSIFWNEKRVYVVMLNRIFKLEKDKWNSKEFNEFKKYAIRNGIEELYLDFDKNFKYYSQLLTLL